MSNNITYSVRLDGFELIKVTLEPQEYKDQCSRNRIRAAIAATYKIPTHYLRLINLDRPNYRWDEEKQKNVPI